MGAEGRREKAEIAALGADGASGQRLRVEFDVFGVRGPGGKYLIDFTLIWSDWVGLGWIWLDAVRAGATRAAGREGVIGSNWFKLVQIAPNWGLACVHKRSDVQGASAECRAARGEGRGGEGRGGDFVPSTPDTRLSTLGTREPALGTRAWTLLNTAD